MPRTQACPRLREAPRKFPPAATRNIIEVESLPMTQEMFRSFLRPSSAKNHRVDLPRRPCCCVGTMENELCGYWGAHFPFAKTAADCGADQRPSLQERYGSFAVYVAKVEAASRKLVRQRTRIAASRKRGNTILAFERAAEVQRRSKSSFAEKKRNI